MVRRCEALRRLLLGWHSTADCLQADPEMDDRKNSDGHGSKSTCSVSRKLGIQTSGLLENGKFLLCVLAFKRVSETWELCYRVCTPRNHWVLSQQVRHALIELAHLQMKVWSSKHQAVLGFLGCTFWASTTSVWPIFWLHGTVLFPISQSLLTTLRNRNF